VRHRVLIVDDEQATLNLFSSVLEDHYLVDAVTSAEQALELVRQQSGYSVVIADVFLPGVSGIEFLAQCARISPDTVRIALTGDPGRETVVDSVNYANVFRFVSKPIHIKTLQELIESALKHFESQRFEREMMETTVRTSVNLLLEVLATLDPASFELSQRLRGSVRLFARNLKLPNVWELELAASLARIGIVALPQAIPRKLAREFPLSARELELLGQVPELGARLLKPVSRMERVAQAIRYQAKNYDGSGLPSDSVARAQIPLGARILRIFMDRAAMEVDGVAGEDAYEAMSARKGVYDPTLLEASFLHFPNYILSAVSADKEVRLVSAEELRPDTTLVTEVRTTERLLLVAAGTQLTPLIVQRIQTHVALGSVTGPFGIQVPVAVPA
jgi:response regulator RpfG family c-di-GMP phosphodiesterase